MRMIVVAVRASGELQDDCELVDDDKFVDLDYLEYSLNEWDAAALDAASQLSGTVVAVSVGGDEAEIALREALALGAERAVRIDPQVDSEDSLVVAKLLSGFIADVEPDLVLCGVQSSDHAGAAVPAALAGYLDWARAAVVNSVAESLDSAAALDISRELEGGVFEESTLQLPAVVSIQTGQYEQKYPSFVAKKKASGVELEVRTPSDLGFAVEEVDSVRGAHRVRLVIPEEVSTGEELTGSATAVADRILAILNEKVR